jgi:hypothetical protein
MLCTWGLVVLQGAKARNLIFVPRPRVLHQTITWYVPTPADHASSQRVCTLQAYMGFRTVMEAAQAVASKAVAAGGDGHGRRLLAADYGPPKCVPNTPFQESYAECNSTANMRPLISVAGLHQVRCCTRQGRHSKPCH